MLVDYSAVVWMSGFMSTAVCGLQKCLKMMKVDYKMYKLPCQEANRWYSTALVIMVNMAGSICMVYGLFVSVNLSQ